MLHRITTAMLQNVDLLLHMGNVSVMLESPIMEKKKKIFQNWENET